MIASALRRRLARNITVNYLFTFLFFTNLTRGVWMIYLAGRGFTLLQLGILESVFHITSFLMEVPTGAVADLWGRKASRILGRTLFLGSLALMFYSTSFALQVLGFIVCALNYNLESGAGEALLYDSMLLLERKDEFMRIKGRQEFLIQCAAILAFLCGGWLAVQSYSANFALSALVCCGAICTGFLFQEPPIGRDRRSRVAGVLSSILRATRRQTLRSLGVIRRRPRIALFILFSELIFAFGTTEFFYLQNHWKALGRDEWYIGVIFAVQCAVSGITGLLAPRIEKRLGERGILISAPFLMLICLWGIALSSIPALFFVLLGILEGVLLVAVSDYINRLIPSRYRATILSYQSMVFSFFMILLFPLVGWIGENWNLSLGFFVLALIASGSTAGFLIFYGGTAVPGSQSKS